MSLRGRSVVITGEVWCTEDLAIEGRVEGPVWCEGGAVTIAAGAQVAGDVIARDISVFGAASGQLIATEVVDLRPGSDVTGAVIAPSVVLHDGARFNGRVEPQRLDAALSVAKFQLKQKGSKTG